MGDKSVSSEYGDSQMQTFTRAVLRDLQTLEKMLAAGFFEENTKRIGAEQEMFLVNRAMCPAPLALEIIEAAKDERLTTEIGRFNLEANLTPLRFAGDCLSRMERELLEIVGVVRDTARQFGSDVVMCGILPTIGQSDLVRENLTPLPRYAEIERVVTKMHGGERTIYIKGLDELFLTKNDTFIEFSNTSFQVHLQVPMSEFINSYNWAQAIAAPVLAAAVNSPLLLGRRLWHETRIALFQHATDTRSIAHQERNQTPRVNFGEAWVKNSILETFREDAVRFRILLTQVVEENSLEVFERGEIPRLAAWRMHNGTIWRWNRACYGVMNNKPSLRIEARFLPAGPTIVDEMANAAFFLGLMTALPAEYGDVTKLMNFDIAKDNFFGGARYGLKSSLVWLDGKSRRASRLILEELLPRAEQGLRDAGIDRADIEKYLGILTERVMAEKTGASWMIDSLAAMDKRAKPNVRMRTLAAAMKIYQEENQPLHTWNLAEISPKCDWIDNYRAVEQFMTTDLFTVRPEDVLDLAANLMHWRHVRHVPVEDDDGNLVGIISHRDLLQLLAEGNTKGEMIVGEVMRTDLITIAPETTTLEALRLMRDRNIGCLPVVKNQKLIGLLTAQDFLTVSARLLEERLKEI